MILQHTIATHYQEQVTIRINPRHINGYVGANIKKFANAGNDFLSSLEDKLWPSGDIFERFSPFKVYSFSIRDRHYSKPVPVESLKKFKKVEDIIRHKDDYKKSFWYKEMKETLAEQGRVNHKNHIFKDPKELDSFFEDYVLGMVESLASNGYNQDIDQDYPRIMIGKNGEIHKSNAGDHRFFISKLVGVQKMPFTVKGVHESFFKTHGIPNNKRGLSALFKAIKETETRYSA
jgi:hypothetical protein